jgi:soluble lytic murein transglycosylase-like protein
MREAFNFFVIAMFLLALCCGYIYSQGGSPFALAGSTHTPTLQGGTDYRSMAWQDAIQYGINPTLFQNQINEESGWNPNAVSQAGAVGIAQIMPSTATAWGVDPHDPVASLKASADHMHWYYQHYGYSYEKALAAYNAGTSTVDSAIAQYGDSWRLGIPAETRVYIAIIMGE